MGGRPEAKAEQTRARLAPALRDLQKRFAHDRERLQRETMKLYADEKASPFAGCLPVLLQAPVVGLIYTLFLHSSIAGHPNALLSERLLGVPLGTSLLGALGQGALDAVGVAVFGILILSIAAVAEITRRTLRPPTPAATSEPSPLASPAVVGMLGVLQFTTAVIAMFVPLAAGLYLLVTVAWTLAQRLILRRRYPLAPSA